MSVSVRVIKFDGFSIKDIDAMRRAVKRVCDYADDHIVVITEAMLGVNSILTSMTEALKNRNKDYAVYLTKLESRHLEIAEKLQLTAKDFSDLKNQLGVLRNLTLQISNSKKFDPSAIEPVMSFGELLASLLLRDVFQELDKKAVWFDIRTVLKADEKSGQPDLTLTTELTKNQLQPVLKKNKIVVTQGAMAETKKGRTLLISNAETNYGACIIGSALQAVQIELWTDVDEILTADRRLVPHAQLVRQMTYDEAAEYAYFARKPLHPAILLPAMQKKVPVLLKNPQNADAEGTLIVSSRNEGPGIRAITFKKGINLINIISVSMLGSHGFLSRVFRVFEKHKTAVDMVSTSEISISVTISDYRNLIAICEDLSTFAKVEIYDKQAMITLIGYRLRNVPGMAARIFNAVKDINVNIISQAASQTNLSFMIDESYVEKAIKALHKEMIESKD